MQKNITNMLRAQMFRSFLSQSKIRDQIKGGTFVTRNMKE